jgi:fructuronate reductase
LSVGIAHIGVGAFHRAHQAVFTEDAIEAAGGDWGIVGVSLRHGDAATALGPQDGLFTLELRSAKPTYRIVSSLRRVLTAPADHVAARGVLEDPAIRVATLTVTEPAYALGPDGELDPNHPGIAHDLANPEKPVSTPGWLLAALAQRRAAGAGPISILSCDNLRENSARLGRSVRTMAARQNPELAAWVHGEVGFPNTMVDAITPASDAALRARVAAATGLDDQAAVQREPFAGWAIEDGFAAPRPAWERVGVEIVANIAGHESLKLHVLNAAHSALAYLGLPRRWRFVREAIADAELCGFLDAMMGEEITPALPGQDVAAYWRATRRRFFEPAIDHRLDQIARDGASKLRERIHPLIIANARAGRRSARLGAVVRAWLALKHRPVEAALDDPALFAEPFRREPAVRAAVLEVTP